VDLDEILYGGGAIEQDQDAVILNPIASTILKWLSFKFLRWMQYLHHSALLNTGFGLVHADNVTMETKAHGLL
jgi:hypothetical protein